MDALAGPYLAAAALLISAGAVKLYDPLPLRRALLSVKLSLPAGLLRAAAAAEVALGLVAVVAGGRAPAVGLAMSYLAFTGFVLLARSRGGVLASCGCFGKVDTPPTVTHAILTAAFGLVAAAVATSPLGALPDLLAGSPGAGLPLVVVTAAVAVTAYLVLARLPMLKVAT